MPRIEEMCDAAGEDKWLMGTDSITQLDISCGAIWDSFYVMMNSTAFKPEA